MRVRIDVETKTCGHSVFEFDEPRLEPTLTSIEETLDAVIPRAKIIIKNSLSEHFNRG